MDFNDQILLGIAFLVLIMISYCLLMLIFFITVVTRINPLDSNLDFLTEKTQVSQKAQYKGSRPSKVKNPVKISDRLFMDSKIGKDLPSLHCDMITVGEMV